MNIRATDKQPQRSRFRHAGHLDEIQVRFPPPMLVVVGKDRPSHCAPWKIRAGVGVGQQVIGIASQCRIEFRQRQDDLVAIGTLSDHHLVGSHRVGGIQERPQRDTRVGVARDCRRDRCEVVLQIGLRVAAGLRHVACELNSGGRPAGPAHRRHREKLKRRQVDQATPCRARHHKLRCREQSAAILKCDKRCNCRRAAKVRIDLAERDHRPLAAGTRAEQIVAQDRILAVRTVRRRGGDRAIGWRRR